MKTEANKDCAQCNRAMKGEQYYDNGLYLCYCKRPECPNYRLLQATNPKQL